MMLNLPIFGVVCEPTISRVKKFEYLATENVESGKNLMNLKKFPLV